MKTKKLDGMLLGTLITTLFYSATYPYIHKEIMTVVSNRMVAANQIVNCVSIILIGTLWNKKSNRFFKSYPLLCVIETLLSVGSCLFTVITKNILAYYVIDTLIFAIVTRNICCGNVKLRAIRYKTEKERECFDNNQNSANAIATIIGSLIAMVLNLDFNIMLWLATIGNTIDNIFYICIFYKTKEKK